MAEDLIIAFDEITRRPRDIFPKDEWSFGFTDRATCSLKAERPDPNGHYTHKLTAAVDKNVISVTSENARHGIVFCLKGSASTNPELAVNKVIYFSNRDKAGQPVSPNHDACGIVYGAYRGDLRAITHAIAFENSECDYAEFCVTPDDVRNRIRVLLQCSDVTPLVSLVRLKPFRHPEDLGEGRKMHDPGTRGYRIFLAQPSDSASKHGSHFKLTRSRIEDPDKAVAEEDLARLVYPVSGVVLDNLPLEMTPEMLKEFIQTQVADFLRNPSSETPYTELDAATAALHP